MIHPKVAFEAPFSRAHRDVKSRPGGILNKSGKQWWQLIFFEYLPAVCYILYIWQGPQLIPALFDRNQTDENNFTCLYWNHFTDVLVITNVVTIGREKSTLYYCLGRTCRKAWVNKFTGAAKSQLMLLIHNTIMCLSMYYIMYIILLCITVSIRLTYLGGSLPVDVLHYCSVPVLSTDHSTIPIPWLVVRTHLDRADQCSLFQH